MRKKGIQVGWGRGWRYLWKGVGMVVEGQQDVQGLWVGQALQVCMGNLPLLGQV